MERVTNFTSQISLLLSRSISANSVVVSIVLSGKVVDNSVALDVGGVSTVLHDDRWPVQVDTVVDNKKRVVVVDHIVVDRDTVQVLLQQVLEEQVLLLKSSLLLLDCQLVEVNLVETLVEVVKLLELVIAVRVNTLNLLDLLLRLLLRVNI